MGRSLDMLRHRGPDDRGVSGWSVPGGTGQIELGSARLAILDLSPAGHMPMISADGRFILAYNGEITNYVELRGELTSLGHVFSSDSDTEVLLQAWSRWGAATLSRLEGMYAFAIVDKDNATLTLARDVFGIKPLFYTQQSTSSFSFASEVPALLEMMPGIQKLDWQVAFDYLHWGAYDNTENTFVAGVLQLMPAHFVTVDITAGTFGDPQRYWWPSVETREVSSESDAADRVRELFLESVRHNLRSDVPVGVALSGGIDSSAIACAVRYLEPDYPLETFSFIAPGFEQSEEEWIALVTAKTGARAHYVESTGTELERDLDSMIRAQGEPFGSTSIYAQYRVFQLAREHDVVVTLDGQGADEIFAGYDGYPAQRLRSLLEKGNLIGAARFVRAWGGWPNRAMSGLIVGGAASMLPRAVTSRLSQLGAKESPAFDYEELQTRGVRTSFPTLTTESSRGNRLKGHLRSESTSRGLPALLRHGDRNSMHFSVESRVPFLSRALTEYVFGLPEHYLVGADGTSKNILRRAMRGIVPDAILDRRDKVGFVTPEKQWLSEMTTSDSRPEAKDPANIGLLQTDAGGRTLVDVLPAAQLGFGVRQQWRLLNLRRWVELFNIDAS